MVRIRSPFGFLAAKSEMWVNTASICIVLPSPTATPFGGSLATMVYSPRITRALAIVPTGFNGRPKRYRLQNTTE